MARTGAQKHTHKYHKINGIWYCSLPDCTHFMPLNVTQSILGKKSLCWSCGNEFVIDVNAMDNDNPLCQMCRLNDPEALLKYIAEQAAKSSSKDTDSTIALPDTFDPLE